MRLDDVLRPKDDETNSHGNSQTGPHTPGERPDGLTSEGVGQAVNLAGVSPDIPAADPAGKGEIEGVTAERMQTADMRMADMHMADMHTAELKAKPAVPQTAKATSPSTSPAPTRNGDSRNRHSKQPDSGSRDSGAEVFSSLRWHTSAPTQAKRPMWEAMPTFNRFLTISGAGCLLLALARVVIPPVVQSAQQAYRPYTAAGKQELCATHLRSIAVALEAYSQDNDGRYPPLDYQNPQGQRATWVSLVNGRVAENDLTCPVEPNLSGGTEGLTASFVLNPVMATARASEMDDPSVTLLSADGGTKHDVSLLPPYPTWPSYGKRRADGGLDAAEANFDFRHGGQSGVVFVDGHVATLSPLHEATSAAAWGGSAVLRRARTRLSQRSPQTGELFKRLQADDVAGAASYLRAHRTALKTISADFFNLWRLNTGEHTSDSVEKLGWNLAQAWKKAGDVSLQRQCNGEQTRRSQGELQSVNSGSWEGRQVAGQPSMRCEAPSAWKFQDEQDGRYRRLYLRSNSPALYALLEVGNRTKYVTPQPINWDGEEKEFQRRYRGNYRRVNRGIIALSGQQASVWEYEVEKPGLPRLHKRLVGYTDGWTSYVISVSAPAQDWTLARPVFDKLSGSVATGYTRGE